MPRDESDEVPFSELERDFFEAAPPDVAQPPPEPMRFDDLDPVAPAQPERPAILVRARKVTAKARTALQSAAGAARERGVPVFGRVRQRSTALWAATVKVAARAGRAQVARVVARVVTMIRNSPREHRLIAAGVVALIVVTGVSAGVVASRGAGAGHPAAPAIPPIVASVVPGACEAPPVAEPAPEPAAPESAPAAPESAPAAPAATADEAPVLGEPIPPPTTTPAQRKRKREQAKAPARPAVRTKAPAAVPGHVDVPPSSARPVFSR